MSTEREASWKIDLGAIASGRPDRSFFDHVMDASRRLATADGQAIDGYVRGLVASGVDPMSIELVIRQETTADAITHTYSVRPRSSDPITVTRPSSDR